MKQLCVISCPIDTHSGYGARSRDFFKALYELKKDEWEFQILSQRWGITPWGYIDSEPEWHWLKPPLNKTGQLTRQPDVWIQITVPNEFQPVGKFNIGITAGIETTICDHSWIEGLNRMNLNLVSSNHAKKVFQDSAFEKRDQQGNVLQKVKLEKPVEVLFEGVDISKYFHIEDDDLEETDLVKKLDEIEEDFCYLFVGHWLQGDIGEDRKNVGLTIKSFLETFQNKKSKPALVIKTSGAGASIMDREEMLKKIDAIRNQVGEDLPNIYLLHGELSDADMNRLYNHGKVKAMYNLTKGEGFGRPILEFAMSKKPIIISAWSGHMDFLIQDLTCLLGGELKNVHPSAAVQNMILQDSQWFSPNISQAKHYLKDVYENYKKYKELAKQQSHQCKINFNFDKMKEQLQKYVEIVPKQVQLQLPKLKKVELPQLKKIELPKLNKV
jgi:glycosyltransferase involved in cell wall biosynthesis